MEKIKSIWVNHKSFVCINIICILFLSIYYGRHVADINTVWELLDEFGYLANADYLVHHNWAQLITSYYGYGYSLLLVPLFYICDTGLGLIQGAIIINMLCMLLTYIISLTLICKLCDFIPKNILAVIAAILCLYPHLTANVFKITCECFLAMMTWLIWLLLFKCLETKKTVYYVFLSLAVTYAFFTHTRALALTIMVVLVLALLCFKKQIEVKNCLVAGVTLAVFYCIGYLLKNYIIAGVYTASVDAVGNEANTLVNIIDLEWVTTRLSWIFSSDFVLYIYSFVCKNFYLFIAGLGLCHWSIFVVLRKLIVTGKEERKFSNVEWIEISIVLSFILMIIMQLTSGAGVLHNVTYFYYGRYFEYLLCPILFLGIKYYMTEGIKPVQYLAMFAFWGICFLGSMFLSQHLTAQTLIIDTHRIASFSFVTKEINQYINVLENLVLYGSLGLIVVFLLGVKEKTRIMILVPLCILFLVNNSANIQQIAYINERDLGDNSIANYLMENFEEDTIFFVNSDYRYKGYYTRMQVLLGDKKLQVIELEDIKRIPEGAYFVGYNSEQAFGQISAVSNSNPVMTGRAFILYQERTKNDE